MLLCKHQQRQLVTPSGAGTPAGAPLPSTGPAAGPPVHGSSAGSKWCTDGLRAACTFTIHEKAWDTARRQTAAHLRAVAQGSPCSSRACGRPADECSSAGGALPPGQDRQRCRLARACAAGPGAHQPCSARGEHTRWTICVMLAGASLAAALSVLTIWPQEAKALAAADAQAQLLNCCLKRRWQNSVLTTQSRLGNCCATETVLSVCQEMPPW